MWMSEFILKSGSEAWFEAWFNARRMLVSNACQLRRRPEAWFEAWFEAQLNARSRRILIQSNVRMLGRMLGQMLGQKLSSMLG